jgi:hypothetical protein
MLIGNHVERLDKTAARLSSAHASDQEIEVVPMLRVGADVPDRGAPVIPATRGGSTV